MFKKLGLAAASDVWLIEKALYGLVASPRDWCIYRDEVLPTLRWTRSTDGEDYVGRFVHSGDDNMWRLMEVNTKTGQETWAGLMSVYVDDLLVSAEPETIQAAMDAVAKTWTISAVEWASTDKPLRYCGFEVLADEHGDGFQVSQKMFEQELLSRWAVSESLAYPAFKINEEDELVTSEISQADIKSAQALTGALLWLSTRTRPDLVHGVSVMSRLVTKNPKKSLEIGHTLLKYLHGNPGGIHFPSGVANGEWGARGQLKVRRHSKLLEVYADIAYAAGSNHRSVQGLVICYAGVPVAWQCNQQPFVTHSTAEAELVSYCEALLAGRASEALLCAIWGEDLNANTFERVMYGDNAAAIGLAHGVTAASWRTRHLRIRSSILKEALHESSDVPGGRWQLTHLKGTELVADGCTKPLNGQAFFRFLEDLGLKRGVKAEAGETTSTGDGTIIGGGGGFAAVKALILGSTLMTAAQGASGENSGGTDYTPLVTTGAVLMALGAVYVGQLARQASDCCLRRFRVWEDGKRCHVTNQGEEAELSDDGSYTVISEDEEPQRATSSKSRRQSGSKSTGANNISLRNSTSSCAGASLNSSSRSGFSTGGSASSDGVGSFSQRMPRQSGHSSATGDVSSIITDVCGESGAPENSTSLRLRTRSGTAEFCAAGEPAEDAEIAAASQSIGALNSSVGDAGRGKGSKGSKKNPWNAFQQRYKGKGLNSTAIAQLYKGESSNS